MNNQSKTRGFTLIEVMISVMIFSIVMTVALGALLAMSQSDQRAEAIKTVINNLNFSLDSMARTIRTGYDYHCDTTGADLSTPAPQDCDGNNTTPAYATYLGLRSAGGTLVAYCLSGGAIEREQIQSGSLDTSCGSANFFPLTSKDVTVSTMRFIVTGSCAKSGSGCTTDSKQPKVTILLSGSITINGTASSTFNLQTSVTQRIYDQ